MSSPSASPKPRIFLVEDDLAVIRMVRSVLERDGFSVQAEEKAGPAVESAKEFKPDLILLDVELPDGSGFNICKALRSEPETARTPILFMTGRSAVDDRLKGFAAGAQDYIPKPFDLVELSARVKAHLAVKGRMDELAKENDELRLLQRIRQDMTDMVLHDLRSPLATIRVTLRLLKESGLVNDTDHSRLLDAAEAATEFVVVTANDIVDLGRGRLEVEAAPVNIPWLMERVESLFKTQIAYRQIRFERRFEGAPQDVVTDQVLLFRILANLVSNAIKFSEPGQSVVLAAEAGPRGLVIEVLDQGPGIPESEREAVFQMGYKLKKESTAPGHGVGLAFCRFAADALGGKVHADERRPKGSRFVVELPFAS